MRAVSHLFNTVLSASRFPHGEMPGAGRKKRREKRKQTQNKTQENPQTQTPTSAPKPHSYTETSDFFPM